MSTGPDATTGSCRPVAASSAVVFADAARGDGSNSRCGLFAEVVT